MGGCAGKKSVQVEPGKATLGKDNGTDDSKVGKPNARSTPQQASELRKLFDEESQYMNRKVKACFEVVFAGDAPQTLDINMKFINLGESGTLYLSKVLPAFTNLKSLRLWKTKLGVEGAKLLGAVLPKLPQLEVLSLEDNEIKTEGASYIAKSLPELLELKELYLHVNKMGQEGVIALSSALTFKSNLRILTMDENQIGKPGLLILLASLSRTLHCVTLLGLAFNMLGDDGAAELIAILKKMPELKKMTLSGNNISPAIEAELMSKAPGVDFFF